MADGAVGQQVVEWLVGNYPDDLTLLVVVQKNEIFSEAERNGIPCLVYESENAIIDFFSERGMVPDLGLLVWWPRIIRPPLVSFPREGYINTHPSLLPHGRGKHYNFWTLVEQAPFGVTLHRVEESVDSGGIVAQRVIPYGWEDSGASLYFKARDAMFKLFKETYPEIRKLGFSSWPQNSEAGSFHFSSELESASEIILDKVYRARDILNLLRARTFPGYPSCWFEENGETFEVRIEIKRKSNE
jgi:methionyl-tRNA formyltransferase